MIEWLKSNVHDYSSCAEKWDKTNKERLKRILSNERESYIQEFPCIRRFRGYTLVCIIIILINIIKAKVCVCLCFYVNEVTH